MLCTKTGAAAAAAPLMYVCMYMLVCALQVLFSMWGHQELREVYKKAGWKEQDFVSKSVAARNAASGGANSPTANNTLNRPMASQGGTRYEDRTIQRGQGKTHQMYSQVGVRSSKVRLS